MKQGIRQSLYAPVFLKAKDSQRHASTCRRSWISASTHWSSRWSLGADRGWHFCKSIPRQRRLKNYSLGKGNSSDRVERQTSKLAKKSESRIQLSEFLIPSLLLITDDPGICSYREWGMSKQRENQISHGMRSQLLSGTVLSHTKSHLHMLDMWCWKNTSMILEHNLFFLKLSASAPDANGPFFFWDCMVLPQ